MRRAVDAAESVLGVRGVINLTPVEPRVSPTSITETIEAALGSSAELDERGTQVSAHDGTVGLTGKVHSFSEREGATISSEHSY